MWDGLRTRWECGARHSAGRLSRGSAPGPRIGRMDAAMRERAALVALLRRPGVSWSEIALEIQEDGSAVSVPDRAVNQPETLFSDARSTAELIDAAGREIAGWRSAGLGVHAFFDDTYPAQLRGIREMPPLLFDRGDLRVHDRAVAVVGSRNASRDGLRIAREPSPPRSPDAGSPSSAGSPRASTPPPTRRRWRPVAAPSRSSAPASTSTIPRKTAAFRTTSPRSDWSSPSSGPTPGPAGGASPCATPS